jgi:uncharacterized protein YhfF
MTSNVDRYWSQFVESLSRGAKRPARYVEAFFFGTKPKLAHEIADLVLAGIKTATGTLVWSLEADGKPLPRAGDYWVVTNGGDDPACIIRTLDAQVIPFNEVEERYARAGGEGDRSLQSWRDVYWSYIVAECDRIGREPDEKAPLVMELFEVVYSEPLVE